MVGGADFMKKGDGGEAFDMKAVLGDVIIVCAQVDTYLVLQLYYSSSTLQLIAACQFVYEEKYIAKYNVHPLKVVGSEGVFGFITLVLLQTGFYFIPAKNLGIGYNPEGRLEDPFGVFSIKAQHFSQCI